jgi:N-acetylglucosamine malate deacetylase 2
MIPPIAHTHDELLTAVFSEEPAPDIQCAVVVAHPGDECIGASWLLSRLSDRLSVFRAARQPPSETDAITLTGLPAERCHSLGLAPGSLAKDLEALTWLVSASLRPLGPRLLATHAVEGLNLDHDAVAFAVQLTASMLPRFGSASPVLLEFQCHHEGPKGVHHDEAAPAWLQGVRVDIGPESRRLKDQILRSQLGAGYSVHRSALETEIYRPQSTDDIVKTPQHLQRHYADAPQVRVGEFLSTAAAVARTFAGSGLITPLPA